MENVNVSTTSQQLIGLFLSVGVPLLVLLFLALITAVLGTEVAARVRAVPSKLRAYVDEPSDPAIMLLDLLADKLTRQEVSPQVIIDVIKAALDAVEKQTVDSPAPAGWQAVTVTETPPAAVGVAYVAPPPAENVTVNISQEAPKA